MGFKEVEAGSTNVHVSFECWTQKIPEMFPGFPVLKRGLEIN